MKIVDQTKTSRVYPIRFVCYATVRNKILTAEKEKKLRKINSEIDKLHQESKKILGEKK